MIRKAILGIGSIMILFSGLILILSVVWVRKPYLIDRLDNAIPDYYGNEIDSNYRRCKNESNVHEKFKFYKILYKKFKNLGPMSRYFEYKNEVNIFVIDYYLTVGEIDKAMKISNYWIKNSPRNFESKFNYMKVLSHLDTDKTLKYYQNMLETYPDLVKS